MNFVLFLTHDCNLRCKYCFNGESYHKDMSDAVARQSIDFMYSTKFSFYNLGFFGGEPLLKFTLIEHIISYAKKKYPEKTKSTLLNIFTNGTLITDKILNFIFENNMNVILSIDGNKKVHDSNRITIDGRGSYDLIFKNMHIWKQLIDKGMISVQLTLTPQTISFFYDSVRHIAENGFRTIIFSIDTSIRWNNENLLTFRRQLEKISGYYIDIIRNSKCLSLCVFDQNLELGMKRQIKNLCQAGELQFVVSTNGDIYPCPRFILDGNDNTWVIGDVFGGFNEKRKEFVDKKKILPDECSGCNHKRRCKNKCAAMNYLQYGDIQNNVPLECYISSNYIEMSDKIAKSLIQADKNKFYNLLSKKFRSPPFTVRKKNSIHML